jgi:two-component system phosphate regulon sensor histidine kinase PhoR
LTAGAPPGTRIELLDLGGPEQRWELLADPLGHKQVVRIVDRTPLRAAEKMRVDFVANASHELRTPLATLIGFIETLEGPAAEDADARHRFLGIMRGEAQRMIRLVDDLMSLSRIEADKHRQPVASVRMVPLVEEVKDALGHRLMKGDRRLLIEAEPDLPSVAGDRDQLLQLLHNLIGNAVKYGRPGTPIVVRMQRDGQSMIRIAVEDQGDGIAPEHLPRLTERFYRVDAGRSRSIGGTGLGLAIVKHIVERHRGQLLIASDPGVGTRVTALLPVASDQG